MFSGGSQFAFIGVLGAGGAAGAAVATAGLLGARNGLYGPQVTPLLGRARLAQAARRAADDRRVDRGRHRPGRPGGWPARASGGPASASSSCGTCSRCSARVLGDALGDPRRYGLDAAAAAAFLALVWPRLAAAVRRRPGRRGRRGRRGARAHPVHARRGPGAAGGRRRHRRRPRGPARRGERARMSPAATWLAVHRGRRRRLRHQARRVTSCPSTGSPSRESPAPRRWSPSRSLSALVAVQAATIGRPPRRRRAAARRSPSPRSPWCCERRSSSSSCSPPHGGRAARRSG